MSLIDCTVTTDNAAVMKAAFNKKSTEDSISWFGCAVHDINLANKEGMTSNCPPDIDQLDSCCKETARFCKKTGY